MPCRVDDYGFNHYREERNRELEEENKRLRALLSAENGDGVGYHFKAIEKALDDFTHLLDTTREKALAGKSVRVGVVESAEKKMDNTYEGYVLIDGKGTPVSRVYRDLKRQSERLTKYLDFKKQAESFRNAMEKDQIKHRKDDIKRVVAGWKAAGEHEKAKQAQSVDVTKPLIPQLGYDPDDVPLG